MTQYVGDATSPVTVPGHARWWRRLGRGILVGLIAGAAIGVFSRAMMRAMVWVAGEEPAFTVAGTVAIVIMLALVTVVAAVPVALWWRGRTRGIIVALAAIWVVGFHVPQAQATFEAVAMDDWSWTRWVALIAVCAVWVIGLVGAVLEIARRTRPA